MNKKKVLVGMSGGVDSSLSAALLCQAGYDVRGAFMKNWTRDLPGFICPWKEDYRDAKTVAVKLGIPLVVLDFEKDYRRLVVDYMVEAYQSGLTPNPDIICNQEVKFKLFLRAALDTGAELIATGHYAISNGGSLYMGKDKLKDQSYFLYRIKEEALKRTVFPLGDMNKTDVRRLARELELPTADKPDSQGICFVGEVGIKQFLLSELGPQAKGPIVDDNGNTIGSHDGALFYTLGQRHGLNVGGGLPYYVTAKDMSSNTVYVTNNLDNEQLWRKELVIGDLWWINDPPLSGQDYLVKCRYRSATTGCRVDIADTKAKLTLNDSLRALSPGQSAVIYEKERVVGGGIILPEAKTVKINR